MKTQNQPRRQSERIQQKEEQQQQAQLPPTPGKTPPKAPRKQRPAKKLKRAAAPKPPPEEPIEPGTVYETFKSACPRAGYQFMRAGPAGLNRRLKKATLESGQDVHKRMEWVYPTESGYPPKCLGYYFPADIVAPVKEQWESEQRLKALKKQRRGEAEADAARWRLQMQSGSNGN